MTAAHRRLAFEELFLLQAALVLRQRKTEEEVKPIRCDPHVPQLKQLAQLLPFTLTSAQERVYREIQADMVTSRPMNRLVQGDVGSGKTVVALHALVMACGSGCQTALMVPTEILAEQHYLNLKPLLEAVGLHTVVFTSGGKVKERNEKLKQVASGTASHWNPRVDSKERALDIKTRTEPSRGKGTAYCCPSLEKCTFF